MVNTLSSPLSAICMFQNDHRHGDHVMVGDVDHCFRFFQNCHTPKLLFAISCLIATLYVNGGAVYLAINE